MPIGLITNCLSGFLGAITGRITKRFFTDHLKETLTLILGLCAFSIGINNLFKAIHMPPIILSIVMGTAIGHGIRLEKHITKAFQYVLQKLFGNESSINLDSFVTAAVLFCASGFGIFGVFTEGMSGNPSILLAKSILDFCTALIIASTCGGSICLIAIPQTIIMTSLTY